MRIRKDKPRKNGRRNPDRTNRYRCGTPIDISLLESRKPAASTFTSSKIRRYDFLDNATFGFFNMCIKQGNPYTILVEKEEEEVREQKQNELKQWFKEAMDRLPKNQAVCIFHRFRLDQEQTEEKVLSLQTTQKVAEIVGISQSTAYRNIQRGIKNLQKDFEIHLKPKLIDKKDS